MKKINYVHTEKFHNTTSPEHVLPYILQLLKPKSMLDVGCGTGTWLKVARQLGVEAIMGIDGIHVDKKMLCIDKDEFLLHDLTLPFELKSKFDLAICLEVAEHLPESAADNLVQCLTHHSDVVMFSAGIPGQGGQAHINEQWPEYWRLKFAQHGFFVYDFLRETFWEEADVQWWYKQNMFIYARPHQPGLVNYNPIVKIRNLVHPELLQEIDEDRNFFANLVKKPKFIFSFKMLIKSLLKR